MEQETEQLLMFIKKDDVEFINKLEKIAIEIPELPYYVYDTLVKNKATELGLMDYYTTEIEYSMQNSIEDSTQSLVKDKTPTRLDYRKGIFHELHNACIIFSGGTLNKFYMHGIKDNSIYSRVLSSEVGLYSMSPWLYIFTQLGYLIDLLKKNEGDDNQKFIDLINYILNLLTPLFNALYRWPY
jgi:hypothetical protein